MGAEKPETPSRVELELAGTRSEQLEVLKYSIDHAPDPAYWFDPTGRFIYVNHAGCKALGYTHEEMLRMHVGQINPRATPERWAAVWKEVKQRGSITLESEHQRKDGSRFPVALTSAYFVYGEKEFLNGFAIDLTERHRAERERCALQAQLLQAQKMESIGRLAGGVAHDFNNMLGVILGNVELALSEPGVTESVRNDLVEIKAAAQRSADLTRQLLAFARRQTVAPRVLDLNDAVAGLVKMLHRLIGEEIALEWRPGRELWPVRLDPSQVSQILTNLAVNARDAIKGVGTLSISTRNVSRDEVLAVGRAKLEAGDFVMLLVRDDGCGMEPGVIEHLFEPFFTTKEPGEGTGLGLATVYGIVEQNGGFIDVESAPGGGTTFSIGFPRYLGETASADLATIPGSTEPGRGTILLVEDEPTILKIGSRMLERLGYRVVAAGSPSEAIRLAEEHAGQIDLLLADVVMPEMNGRDLAKRILSIRPSLKRLFISGYPADVIARRGVLEEGVHFLQKPFTLEALAVKVREALGRS